MKKPKNTEKEKQREMEEFSRRVREFREAQRKSFFNAIDETVDIQKDNIEIKNLE